MVDVQLQGIRSGRLDPAGVVDPATGRGGVEAANDRHRHRGLDPFERGEVPVGGAGHMPDRREVVERLGEVLGPLLERSIQVGLLGQDVLLEQGGQDDRADPGPLKAPGEGGVHVQRRR